MSIKLSRDIWVERVAQWRASGMSGVAFAQANNFSASTLKGWVARLKAEALFPAPALPVRLHVQENPPELNPEKLTLSPKNLTPASSALSPLLKLQHPNGWQLFVPDCTHPTWLAQLLKALT